MKTLSTLDSNPRQSLYFVTDDKERLKLSFYYLPTQQNWFIDIESENFTLYGTRLCCHPNLLNKYHNIIGWGLSVLTVDGLDPFQVTDFSSGYCQVSILDKEEVAIVEAYLNGETQ